jgi:ferritin-like metal-binding protein YciE
MGMKGLIEEGRQQMEWQGADQLKDAAIIGAAQRVEHHEISGLRNGENVRREIGNESGSRASANNNR